MLPAAEIVQAVLTSERLPLSDEFALQELISPAFALRTKALANRLEALLQKVAGTVDADEITAKADAYREAAYVALDEAKGVSSKQIKINVQPRFVELLAPLSPRILRTYTHDTHAMQRVIRYAGNLSKPQIFFPKPIDNSRDAPFKPLISSKPHAIVPLPEVWTPNVTSVLPASMASHLASLGIDTEPPREFFPNPYEVEINQSRAPSWMWSREAQFARPKEDCEFLWVHDLTTFNEMLHHLEDDTHKAIAVDVEHHSLRTFLGLTCVIQISTVKMDFVVDALALRTEMARLLNVFANPSVVKVYASPFLISSLEPTPETGASWRGLGH